MSGDIPVSEPRNVVFINNSYVKGGYRHTFKKVDISPLDDLHSSIGALLAIARWKLDNLSTALAETNRQERRELRSGVIYGEDFRLPGESDDKTWQRAIDWSIYKNRQRREG